MRTSDVRGRDDVPFVKAEDHHRKLRIDRMQKSATAVRRLHGERGILITEFRAMVNAMGVAQSAPARWLDSTAGDTAAVLSPPQQTLVAPTAAGQTAGTGHALPASTLLPAPLHTGLSATDRAVDALRKRVRPRVDNGCARCVVARTDATARASYTNPSSGGSARGRNVDAIPACPLFDHGVQLNSLTGVLHGIPGLAAKDRKQTVVDFMRSEHGVEPLGIGPQYRVALYTPSATGVLQPVDKEGVLYPPGTRETRGHYVFFQGMQLLAGDGV